MASQEISKIKEFVLALASLSAVFIATFYDFFVHPSRLLPAAGDGMKNYFTYLYHIKYDKNYWKFDGMNYPFGENVVFTDNQPILSNLVKAIYQIFPISTSGLIAIHNWVVFLGIIGGGLGFFYSLKLLKVRLDLAIATSAGIMLLQPHILRLESHYSMAFSFLPWIFYFWIRIWQNDAHKKTNLWIGTISFFAGMIHMYHFLAISMTCILAIFLTFVIVKDWKSSFGALLLQVVVPFIFLFVISNYIYPVHDRPSDPWGFFSYTATWETLFFSYKLPLFPFIDENIFKIRTINQREGLNYMGLVAALSVIILIFRSARAYKKIGQIIHPKSGINAKLGWIFLLSALASFGFPFIISGLEWLLSYAGPFKQFRAVGRLAWVSFFAVNLIALPFVFTKLAGIHDRFKSNFLSYSIVSIILIEAIMLKPSTDNPPQLIDAFKEKTFDVPINFNGYQAILPDPYLHIGSECFGWADLGGNQDQNFKFGYQSGLPNLGVVLSRNSLSQSLLMNELICKPYKVPDIIQVIKKKDQRPLLVFYSKLELYNRGSGLDHWTSGAPVVYENNDFVLKKLELPAFDTIVQKFNSTNIENYHRTKLNLEFLKVEKESEWGFEAYSPIDTSWVGERILSFNVNVEESTDANAIFDIYQMDANHQLIHKSQDRVNYYFKKINGNKMLINKPVHIYNNAHKIIFRLSKFNQSKDDKQFFEDFELLKSEPTLTQ